MSSYTRNFTRDVTQGVSAVLSRSHVSTSDAQHNIHSSSVAQLTSKEPAQQQWHDGSVNADAQIQHRHSNDTVYGWAHLCMTHDVPIGGLRSVWRVGNVGRNL